MPLVIWHCQEEKNMIECCCVAEDILYIAAAYLIGSIPFGFLIGKLRGTDLREHCSHNIGATNAMRVLGRKWGILVFALDSLKGCLPTLTIVAIQGQDVANYSVGQAGLLLGVIAGLTLGHTFTCFLRFRGGKGVATMAGCLVGAFPVVAGWAVCAWVLMMIVTRYVSLSSIMAGVIMVLASLVYFRQVDGVCKPTEWMIPGALFLILLLIVYRHRENLRRIADGTEPKAFSKKN